MYNLDSTIDAIQHTNKKFVGQFVKDDRVIDSINALLDAQTTYTKTMSRTAMETSQHITQELINVGNQVSDVIRTASDQISKNNFAKQFNETFAKSTVENFWKDAAKWYQFGQPSAKTAKQD